MCQQWQKILLKTVLFGVLVLLLGVSNLSKPVFRPKGLEEANKKNDPATARIYEVLNIADYSASIQDLAIAQFPFNLSDNSGFFVDWDFYCPTFTFKDLMEESVPSGPDEGVSFYNVKVRYFPYEALSLTDKKVLRLVRYSEVKERLQLLEQAGQGKSLEARRFAAALHCYEREPEVLRVYPDAYPPSYYAVKDEQGKDILIRLKRDQDGKFLRATLDGISAHLESNTKRFRGPYVYQYSTAALPFSSEKLFLLATLNWFFDPISQEKILYQRLAPYQEVVEQRDQFINLWREQQEKKEAAQKTLLLEQKDNQHLQKLENRLKRIEAALERIESKL